MKKYINENKYNECQLITALNAHHYLIGRLYCKQNSDKYEELVDLVKARHGAAIGIEKAWRKLGLKVLYQCRNAMDLVNFGSKKFGFKNRTIPLPVELNIWHKRYGFHSTLIVDQCLKTGCYKITNFKWETSSDGWIFVEDLYKFVKTSIGGNWCYRLFGLNKCSDLSIRRLY